VVRAGKGLVIMDKRMVISALLSSINDEIVLHEYGDGFLADLPLTFSDGDSIRLLLEPMGAGVRVSDQASAYERLMMADVNTDSRRAAEAIAATVRAGVVSSPRACSAGVSFSPWAVSQSPSARETRRRRTAPATPSRAIRSQSSTRQWTGRCPAYCAMAAHIPSKRGR